MKRTSILMMAVAAISGALILNGVSAPTVEKTKSMNSVSIPKYRNEDFYKDGTFQAEKAKAAYFEMMQHHGYLISENLRSNMWATDFGLGDFIHVGMAGIFWINDEKHSYFGHEIFLLPGQMIVEHAHEPTAKGKAKMESWQVRNGGIYTIGEEGGAIPASVTLPKSQEKFITVKKCYPMVPGELRTLNRVGAKHYMISGPQGAIVTEYGTFHDNDGLRFTNPDVKF